MVVPAVMAGLNALGLGYVGKTIYDKEKFRGEQRDRAGRRDEMALRAQERDADARANVKFANAMDAGDQFGMNIAMLDSTTLQKYGAKTFAVIPQKIPDINGKMALEDRIIFLGEGGEMLPEGRFPAIFPKSHFGRERDKYLAGQRKFKATSNFTYDEGSGKIEEQFTKPQKPIGAAPGQGIYDPVSKTWLVKPDAKKAAAAKGSKALSGVVPGAGIYDPIARKWLVEPNAELYAKSRKGSGDGGSQQRLKTNDAIKRWGDVIQGKLDPNGNIIRRGIGTEADYAEGSRIIEELVNAGTPPAQAMQMVLQFFNKLKAAKPKARELDLYAEWKKVYGKGGKGAAAPTPDVKPPPPEEKGFWEATGDRISSESRGLIDLIDPDR